MSLKTPKGARTYVLIAALIGVAIIVEWITVFFFGHVPAGYP
jgi:hypothetical protein